MSLEREIGQTHFRSGRQKALLNILYTHSFLISRMNDVFKTLRITRQQYNVLRILRGAHPEALTVNMVKERMLDRMSDASRIVERLRIKGLIMRRQSQSDRRAAHLRISPKGLELLHQSDSQIAAFDQFLDNLKEEEVNHLNQLLDKLRDSKPPS